MIAGLPEITGGILIAIGAFFYVVGAVGIYRMPDVFTRMHAAGISDTVGAGLLLAGMMFFGGLTLVTVKLAIILGIILFTSPVATHALAQAALHAGVEPVLDKNTVMRGPGVQVKPGNAKRAAKKKPAAAARKPVAKPRRDRQTATARKRRSPT